MNRFQVYNLRNRIALLAILSMLMAGGAYSGANTWKFPKCVVKKYHAHTKIKDSGGTTYCNPYDKGCSYAHAQCSGPPYYPDAYADAYRDGNGKNEYAKTITSKWTAGDDAFINPTSGTTIESLGVARAKSSSSDVVDSITGNVTIQNIEGFISAKKGTLFGSLYRIIVWKMADDLDTVLTAKKVLWDASVRIEGDSVITTGGFSSADFTVLPDELDSTGWHVTKVVPVAGLGKYVAVNVGDPEHVVLSEFCEVGYGRYNPNFPYDDLSSGFSVPTLAPMGLVFLAFLTAATAVWAIRRRQIASLDRNNV